MKKIIKDPLCQKVGNHWYSPLFVVQMPLGGVTHEVVDYA